MTCTNIHINMLLKEDIFNIFCVLVKDSFGDLEKRRLNFIVDTHNLSRIGHFINSKSLFKTIFRKLRIFREWLHFSFSWFYFQKDRGENKHWVNEWMKGFVLTPILRRVNALITHLVWCLGMVCVSMMVGAGHLIV